MSSSQQWNSGDHFYIIDLDPSFSMPKQRNFLMFYFKIPNFAMGTPEHKQFSEIGSVIEHTLSLYVGETRMKTLRYLTLSVGINNNRQK
jgi:hypothetical protein